MDFPEDILQTIIENESYLAELRDRPNSRIIDRIDKEISYDIFLRDYLLPNRACVFGSWVTENWKSRDMWVKDGTPDLNHLRREFGMTQH